MLEQFTIVTESPPKAPPLLATYYLLISIVVAVLADQLSKWLAIRYLTENFQLIPGLLWFQISKNSGIAFSLPVPNIVMLIATPLILIAMFLIMKKHLNSKISNIALGLIVGGGSGNYIDRILSGAVTDFIATPFWPTFNVADTLLVCGAFLLIIFHGRISTR